MHKHIQQVRNLLIKSSRVVFRNPLGRKKAIVAYYNLRAWITRLSTPITDYNPFKPSTSGLKNRFRIDEVYRGNALYGIGPALRTVAGRSKPLPACIEHGLVLGDSFDEDMFDGALPAVLTMSDLRANRFCERGLDAVAIGPYISYTQPHLSEEKLTAKKKELGKVLLVFPYHSIEENPDSQISEDVLVREIDRCVHELDFSTVVISVYYNDFLLGRHKPFEELGYVIFCAGHRYDPEFLSRLKTMLLLSDYCLTDGIGTHIGYAVALGKPVELVGDTWLAVYRKKEERKEAQEIADAFSYGSTLGRQRDIASKYFNIDKELGTTELEAVLSRMDYELEAGA